jgi:hypothetical protein
MKTAVEQLIDEFHEELKVANEIGNKDKIRIIKHLITIATSYLPMEKEQIINANWEASEDTDRAEQYYNETFK